LYPLCHIRQSLTSSSTGTAAGGSGSSCLTLAAGYHHLVETIQLVIAAEGMRPLDFFAAALHGIARTTNGHFAIFYGLRNTHNFEFK
jgi:hypothetical protein